MTIEFGLFGKIVVLLLVLVLIGVFVVLSIIEYKLGKKNNLNQAWIIPTLTVVLYTIP